MHHTMDGQIHTIGKAIRPLFADPVTNLVLVRKWCVRNDLKSASLRDSTTLDTAVDKQAMTRQSC